MNIYISSSLVVGGNTPEFYFYFIFLNRGFPLLLYQQVYRNLLNC